MRNLIPVPSRATAQTLLAGILGGVVFDFFGLPAAWLSGSMVAVTGLALARIPVEVPDRIRDLAFVLLGLSLGAAFTPEALAGAVRWPWSLMALFISLPVIIAAGLWYLIRFGGWDRATAFFSVVPGALSLVMAFALESKADSRLVALAQSLRIFILVALVPLFVVAGSSPAADLTVVVGPALLDGPTALAALVAGGIVSALVVRRGMGLMFAPMAFSAVLHGTGVIGGRIPGVLLIPGLILFGCMIGRRFEGAGFALIRQALGPSMGAFVVTLVVASGFAFGVAWALVLPPSQVFLAFAPGGLEAMMLLAFILGVDPAFVGVHHLARFLGLTLALPFVARPFLDK